MRENECDSDCTGSISFFEFSSLTSVSKFSLKKKIIQTFILSDFHIIFFFSDYLQWINIYSLDMIKLTNLHTAQSWCDTIIVTYFHLPEVELFIFTFYYEQPSNKI